MSKSFLGKIGLNEKYLKLKSNDALVVANFQTEAGRSFSVEMSFFFQVLL